jgi:hypothetical protein
VKKKLAILIFFSLLFSCKKYGDGYIKGTVGESDTGNPIPGAKVYLEKWKTHQISDAPIERIDSTTTGNSGEYYFKFHKKRGYRYRVSCSSIDYYEDAQEELTFKETTKDFLLDPVGYVKLRLIKKTFSYTFFNGSINYRTFNIMFAPNDPYDTILQTVYRARGNSINHIEWEIRNKVDGAPTVTMPTQDIFIARGDTVLLSFQIN